MYCLVLVVSVLSKRATTEINVSLATIEQFGSSLLMTTTPSASKLFFPNFWELLLSYQSVGPCS